MTKHTLNTLLPQSGGTRGDVQPALALACRLAARGHRVRLAADASFRGMVQQLQQPGLEFWPLAGSARDMMRMTVEWG